jgi:transposase InsO family protein
MIHRLGADYPVSLLCEVLDVPRSTVYYEPQSKPEDIVFQAAIERLLMRWPFYGYRRVTAQLKREGYQIGETRVRRLLKGLDHSASVGRVRVATTDSRHGEPRFPNLVKDLNITAPNQVWVADITYIRLGRRFLYLAVILDAFTRGLRGWHLGRSLESQDLTEQALTMALSHHPAPDIHHSDQGKQYAAASYRALLPAATQVSMAAVGTPTENALVERFIRTLKEEHIDYSDYRDFTDALAQLSHWLEVEYMTERIHSSLDYLTPVEFETAFFNQSDSPLVRA